MKTTLRNIPTAILSYLWTLAIVSAFLASTTLSKTHYLSIYFALIIIAMTLIKYRLLLYPIIVVCTLQVVSLIFNQGNWFTLAWLQAFIKRISTEAGDGFMSNELAMIVFIVFIIINLILIVRLRKWKLSFFMVSLYLLALVAIDQSYIQNEVIIYLYTSFCLAYYLKIQNDKLPIKPVKTTVVMLVLALLIYNAQGFPKNFNTFHRTLQENTKLVRTSLREKGFYEIQKIGRDQGFKGVVGFSEQDNSLGGPISKNSSVVFEVKQSRPHNWRIETKELYTGTGWESALGSGEPITLPLDVVSDATQYKTDGEEIEFVMSKEGITYLPVPLEKTSIAGVDDYQIGNGRYEPISQRIRMNGLQRNELKQVRYSVNEMDLSLDDVLSKDSVSDPRNTIDYLQVPVDLPSGIEALALAIIGDETNDYLKVKKIEAYFNERNGTENIDNRPFTYSLSDAEYTPDDRDFVDYFLFDTRIGYCEHYSTAMVVMLRSLGIHSRWVKGYAAGRSVEVGRDGLNTYRITGDEAHAWPEVYFEDVGWLAFEPTPGFDNLQVPTQPETADPEASGETNPNVTETKPPIKEEHLPQDGTKPVVDSSKGIKLDFVGIAQGIVFGGLLISGLYYYFRKHIRLTLWLRNLKHNKEMMFAQTYADLMKHAEGVLVREASDSVREYAMKLDWDLKCDSENLSTVYESILYGLNQDTVITDSERQRFIEIGQLIQIKLRKKS